MARIFVSYRRSEAEFAAGALGRELRQRFGNEQVFRDKENIAGGVSWKKHVLDEIGPGSALVVVMGSNWASVTDAQGHRRLDNPDDPIRLEIADALKDGALVLPVLLENAEMPAGIELPNEIRAIADLNALRLRDGDWQNDVDKLCAVLQTNGFRSPKEQYVRRLPRFMLIVIVVLAFGIAGAVGYSLLGGRRSAEARPLTAAPTPAQPAAQPEIHRPHLDYGIWTLEGKIDEKGKYLLDGSTLKFTSQSDTADGLLLEGKFTWRVNAGVLGEEIFKGRYVAATRGIFLEGESIKDVKHPELPRGSLVVGSYSAVLSADERELVDGRNGSTAGVSNVPLRWTGVR